MLLGLFAPILAVPRRAAADDIDGSIRDLRSSRVYKVRLSAALRLAKRRDARTVVALARALESDPERTVRRVAALSLARLIGPTIAEAPRRAAMAALERASQSDRDREVRRSAQLALERLRGAIVDYSSSASRIFVHVGVPDDRSRALPSGTSDELLAAVRGSLRLHAPDYEMASGALPTRAWLESRSLRGFAVTARVAHVAVEPKGNRADVKCTVSVRISPWSGLDGNERLSADESASVTGNGRVTSSRPGARRAAVDCAVAVAEELAARQIVPFLRSVAAASY